jgi:thiamine transport system permease protein
MLNISVVEAAGNSLRNAFVVLLISLPIAWVLARKPGRLIPILPAGISPVVLGLGTLALAGYLPRELTSSWILLPLVQIVFALPIAYQILQPARAGIARDQLDAASLDGAGWIKITWFVEIPQLRRSISIAAAFVVLTSLGEFGAASFLAFGSNETLPIVMFQLAGRPGGDNYGMVMTAAAIYILLTAWILWIITRTERTEPQEHPTA